MRGSGLTIEVPPGWEGAIGRSGTVGLQGRSDVVAPTVAHLANFPMPAQRADFGAEVVERMRAGDVFMVLFEYDRASAGTALFASRGVPTVAASDFDRNALQYRLPGQSGLQRFFTQAGRAFCLYVVVGSHIDRADVIPQVNTVLSSLVID